TADFTYLANGLSVSFTSSNQAAGATYAWDFTSNGSTDNTTANPTYTFLTPGTYNVSLTITTPCGSDVQTYQIVVAPVGIEELGQKIKSVYPNPANDYLELDLTDKTHLSIYSIIGTLLFENELEPGSSRLDIASLPAGVYYLRAEQQLLKIVKQ
ncbi:MAG: T9SS C-terminal target domain-containing protein, partial [Chitinophagia bacterium]|nr:T9SS C-terminal target domain-containing protein [Chitinophagia bacterium]